MSQPTDTTIRPFTIDIPQSQLDDLKDRLERARWPDELPGDGGLRRAPGLRPRPRRPLADELRLAGARGAAQRLPPVHDEIDGQNVHFLHVRSPEPNALPLILTHGWPGSIVEFLDVIGPSERPAGARRRPRRSRSTS